MQVWRLKRMLMSVISLGLVIYLLLGATLFLFQDSLLFMKGPSSRLAVQRLKIHEIAVHRDDVRLAGWLIPASQPASPTIVYYGGNAEELSRSVNYLSPLGDYNYLYVNYRGYGDSEGEPGEQVLLQDALTIIDVLSEEGRIDPRLIIPFGRSLGSCIAAHVAAQRPVLGLVLVTPFDSLAAVARAHYPLYPVEFLMKHRFRCTDDAASIRVPTLIVMADKDRVIPRARSEALIKAWRGPLSTVTIPGTSHNDITGRNGEFFSATRDFLMTLVH